MKLAHEVARKLILAGYQPNDPGLTAIRAWNQRIRDRIARELAEAEASSPVPSSAPARPR